MRFRVCKKQTMLIVSMPASYAKCLGMKRHAVCLRRKSNQQLQPVTRLCKRIASALRGYRQRARRGLTCPTIFIVVACFCKRTSLTFDWSQYRLCYCNQLAFQGIAQSIDTRNGMRRTKRRVRSKCAMELFCISRDLLHLSLSSYRKIDQCT